MRDQTDSASAIGKPNPFIGFSSCEYISFIAEAEAGKRGFGGGGGGLVLRIVIDRSVVSCAKLVPPARRAVQERGLRRSSVRRFAVVVSARDGEIVLGKRTDPQGWEHGQTDGRTDGWTTSTSYTT